MTMTIHIGKFQQQKYMVETLFQTMTEKGNVEDIMIKCLIIRKDGVIPCSETIVIMTVFYDHILYMIWK